MDMIQPSEPPLHEKLRQIRLNFQGQVVSGEQMRRIRGVLLGRVWRLAVKQKPFQYHEVSRATRLASH